MRSRAILVLVAACGGGAEPPREAHIDALPDASTTGSSVLGIPHDAPIVVSIDAAQALSLLNALPDSAIKQLGVPSEFLVSDPSALGIDVRRPITIAPAGLDDAERKLLEELRPFTATEKPATTGHALASVRALQSTFPVRVLVPASNPKRLEALIDAALREQHYEHGSNGYVNGSQVIAVTVSDAAVAVDFGRRQYLTETAAALEAALSQAHDPPPPLDGKALRATWSTAALASYSFVAKVVYVYSGALSSEGLEPALRERVAIDYFWEAARTLVLARAGGGAFERVELTVGLSPISIVVRATPGAGVVLPPDSAWSPSLSFKLEGTEAQLESTRAFRTAWPFPTGDMSDLLGESGTGGWAVGLPHVLASAPSTLGKTFGFDFPDEPMMGRFERVEGSMLGDDRPFIGVLPAGTPRAVAECSFAPLAGCNAASKLKLGAVVHRDGELVKLVEIDHRFVVIRAHEIRTFSAKLSAVTAGPLHVEAATQALAQLLKITIPPLAHADVSRDHDAIVFRLSAP